MQQEPGELAAACGRVPWAESPALTPSLPGPQSTDFREPVQRLTPAQVEQRGLRYYNADVHRAAFVLPEFARKVSGLPGGRPRAPWRPPCPHTALSVS